MSHTLNEPSRSEIWKMFDSISSTYDKTNRLMTMGLDLYWRKKMSFFLPKKENLKLLDCATGTADQIISLLKNSSRITEAKGIDLSEEMIQIGRKKISASPFKEKVALTVASALDLPFEDETFDCITMSFGIRNVTSVNACLQEMFRTLKPEGRVLILETSIPKSSLLKALHLFYLRKILPFVGGIISKQKKAYEYLNQTTETFPSGLAFAEKLQEVGFKNVVCHPLTFGSVSIYIGDKPL